MLLLWDCGGQTARMMITLTPALGLGYRHTLSSAQAATGVPLEMNNRLPIEYRETSRPQERICAPMDRDISGGSLDHRCRCNMTESSLSIRVAEDCKGNARRSMRPLLTLHDVCRSNWANARLVTRSKQIPPCCLCLRFRLLQTFYSRRRPKRPYHCSRKLAIFLTSCLE